MILSIISDTTGIRPGEKLYEELLTAEEGTTATKHKRIFVAKSTKINFQELSKLINQLERLSFSCRREEIIHILKLLVPTYKTKHAQNDSSQQHVG